MLHAAASRGYLDIVTWREFPLNVALVVRLSDRGLALSSCGELWCYAGRRRQGGRGEWTPFSELNGRTDNAALDCSAQRGFERAHGDR